ncbi:MAG: putative hydroxymethylpyrimidine transporter CytX [Chloroflexaceae bacterium]
MALHRSFPALTPVPKHLRIFQFGDCFALWSSLGVGLLVLQAGALLAPGLSFWAASAAIVLGSLIGATLLGLAGVIGSDTGVATMAALRPTLGIRGASLPTLLNVLQLIGWGTFEIVVMRESAHAMTRAWMPVHEGVAIVLWTLLWGTLATLLAFGGPLAFVRRFLKRWGIWLVYAAALWLTIQVLWRADLPTLLSLPGTGEMSFGTAVDLVVAMPLSWLPLVADYTRFAQNSRQVFRGTALGYLLANVWFYALGVAYVLTLGATDLIQSILLAAGGWVALMLILVDETDNAFADIYSAAVSTGNLATAWTTARLALIFGAVCTVLALVLPIARYEHFLLLIGSLFAPLFGVVLTDHFLVRQRRVEIRELDRVDGLYWYQGGWNWSAFLAWGCGVATFQVLTRLLPEFGATLPAVLIGGVVYLTLIRISAFRAGMVRPQE